MASAALIEWQTARAERLAELFDAHKSVGGTGKGRRYRTEQLNWALTLRLAAEFQGFARSLHDLAANELATRTATFNPTIGLTLSRLMNAGRILDRGNPGPDALNKDFGKLGMTLWPTLNAGYPSWAPRANQHLTALLSARNAIAHADDERMIRMESEGYSLKHLSTVRSWQGWINRLTLMMDVVVGEHVGTVFAEESPW